MTTCEPDTIEESAALRWVPASLGTDVEDVDAAITSYHEEHGDPPPFANALVDAMVDAVFEVVEGFAYENCPHLLTATRVRVTLRNGARYLLSVEREGDLCGDHWSEMKYLHVIDAKAAR